MSLWRVKSQSESSNSEWLTFSQLAERLVDGRVNEADLVQGDAQGEWVSVESIPGLLRTALQISRATGILPSCEASSENAPHETRPGEVLTELTSTSLDVHQAAFFNRPLPAGLTIGILTLIGGGAWLVNEYWTQSRRFPIPRHMVERPSEWVIPVVGRVSFWELILLLADGIVLLSAIFWLLWRRMRR